MKRIIALILAILICSSLMCACGQSEDAATGDEAASNTVQTTTEKVLTDIETPYAVLKVPSYFKDNVKTEVTEKDPYTLKFFANDDTELFTLIFGGEGENLLGTLINNDVYTVIYADIPELDPKSEKYAEYSEYQDCLGSITENLKNDYEFVANTVLEAESNETFDIKTDVCTFKYPKKWEDKVSVESEDNSVKFTCGSVKLFDIYFSEQENGIYLGKYNDTPLYLITYSLSNQTESKEELEQLAAMQDDVNVIIDQLSEDEKFSK